MLAIYAAPQESSLFCRRIVTLSRFSGGRVLLHTDMNAAYVKEEQIGAMTEPGRVVPVQ
jgi:hypothetical protein